MKYYRETYYKTLFYKIIKTETKSLKQDLIVTFGFKYFDYNITNTRYFKKYEYD